MRTTALPLLALATLLVGCGADTPAPPDPPAATPTAAGDTGAGQGSDSPSPQSPAPRTPSPADAFLQYATGAGPGTDVPWAEEVAYSIEGTIVTRLDPAAASTRPAWDGCVADTATVEGRGCPVNVLLAIADRDRKAAPVLVETTQPGPVLSCVRHEPPSTEADETVQWLRPPDDLRDCFSDMAVAVTASATGEIVAVDLALSGP